MNKINKGIVPKGKFFLSIYPKYRGFFSNHFRFGTNLGTKSRGQHLKQADALGRVTDLNEIREYYTFTHLKCRLFYKIIC